MASNCAEALEPLYQATLSESDIKNRAHLYLSHCQFVLLQNERGVYNLEQVSAKHLADDDKKLYKSLKKAHQGEIDALHKLYFNASPYFGVSSNSPKEVKGDSTYYGLSLGVSRPTWSVGAFYEDFTMKMVPTGYKTYTQSMMGAQLGYFILPTWRVSGSYTKIGASTDQLKTTSVVGLQTDYYITPLWSVFLEYYASDYPTLFADTAGIYKYDVKAGEVVGGLRFPIYNALTWGLNGTASYTSISLTKPSDNAAVVAKGLANDTAKTEAGVSAWFSAFTAGLTYWSGTEVLGVRGRGAAVYNSTDLHKNGAKASLGYVINAFVGLNVAYGMETFEASNVSGDTIDYKNTSTTVAASFNW